MDSSLVDTVLDADQERESCRGNETQKRGWWKTKLDATPNLTLSILGHRMASWRVFAVTGMLFGAGSFLLFTRVQHLGIVIPLLIVGIHLVAFNFLNKMSEWVFGTRRIVLLEHLLVTPNFCARMKGLH